MSRTSARALILLAICAASPALPDANAADAAAPTVRTVVLPGGVEGIRLALDDRIASPPATAVADLTRRFYNSTGAAIGRDAQHARLLAWLRECEAAPACASDGDEVPLPGDAQFWREVLGLDRARPLMLALVASRRASLLYTALLSMDEETRIWVLAQRALRRLSDAQAGALAVAAPYLRIRGGRWDLPGGRGADEAWVGLTGARPDRPDAFLQELLRARGGLVAYLLEVLATLDADRQAAALALHSPDRRSSVDAARRLVDALDAIAGSWRPQERPFFRPSADPAWLLARLPVDARGHLLLPGGRGFWEAALAAGDAPPPDQTVLSAWADAAPVTPSWLLERLAAAPPPGPAVRFEQVLFASRRLAGEPAARAVDVMTVLRGYLRFPQLVRVLERAGLDDVSRMAAMVRRASDLAAAGDGWRARAATMQWQSIVVLIDRGARAGALARADVDAAVDVLSADAGGWTSWLGALGPLHCDGADLDSRSVERTLISRIVPPPPESPRAVEWEGMAYRLDFGEAERDRLARVRGADDRPLLDGACIVAALAKSQGGEPGGPTPSGALSTVAAVARAAAIDRPAREESAQAVRRAADEARRRLAGGADAIPGAARTALADLAGALATSALVEMAYAASMGWGDGLPLTASAAARRHVLVHGREDRSWQAPAIVNDRQSPWHVAGSLLGLDVALAPVALRRLSMRPPAVAPLVAAGDRTILEATAAVLDHRSFTDEGQRLLRDLVTRARGRIQSVSGPDEAREMAMLAGTSPLRQTVAGWLAGRGAGALDGFFSPVELARLGRGGVALPVELAGWGAYEEPLTGRPIAGSLPGYPWERFAGRTRRQLACAVPDLQLTLAIELAEMEMPASLVPSLMTAATLDVANTAPSRYPDDWHALVTRIAAVDRDAVERYLALLTTGGPLRPATASPR